MGNPKVKKRKDARTFDHIEWNAKGHANRVGLYIVFDGKGESRHWSVYWITTGKIILGYWPASRKWRDNDGKVGKSESCHEMLDMAVRIAKGYE